MTTMRTNPIPPRWREAVSDARRLAEHVREVFGAGADVARIFTADADRAAALALASRRSCRGRKRLWYLRAAADAGADALRAAEFLEGGPDPALASFGREVARMERAWPRPYRPPGRERREWRW